MQLGYKELPVEVEGFPSEEAEMERLLRENENRGKTPEQQIREGMMWEPIEEGKARARIKNAGEQNSALKKLKDKKDADPCKKFYKGLHDGRVFDIIARRVGLGSGVTYEK